MIKEQIQLLEKDISFLDGKISLLNSQINEDKDKLEENKQSKELYQKCLEILDIAQVTMQAKMKEGFENVSTNALQSVFGSNYSLELEFDKRGNIPEAHLSIKAPDMQEKHDPESSNAGGQKDLVSLILRLVVLSFVQPNGEVPLILDEPFSQLGAEDSVAAFRCLKSIVNKFNRQVIMVTHNRDNEFLNYADNVINFEEIGENNERNSN